ncbi:MAG: gliding motility-associated C-terminal domain-containing protein, partial [Bacteroidota bacterium]
TTKLSSATVVLEWDVLPPAEDVVAVILERDDGSGFAERLRQAPSDPNRLLQDFDVNVHNQSYLYRISIEDTCGDRSPEGLRASSLYLEADKANQQLVLNWNPYLDWAEGVKEYRVEIYDEDIANWVLFETTSGDSLRRSMPELGQRTYCFRVWARGFQTWQRSLSNETCLPAGPIVFVPNAFSPNNDGNNDRFVIQGLFLEDYEIQIFNRWGRLIFASQNVGDSWDGTSEGRALPEGVYAFVVTGKDEFGDEIERKGTVTLVR